MERKMENTVGKRERPVLLEKKIGAAQSGRNSTALVGTYTPSGPVESVNKKSSGLLY